MRIAIWKELLKPSWVWLVAGPLNVLGNAQTIIGQFSQGWKEWLSHNIPDWLTAWDAKTAIIMFLLTAWLMTLESAYRAIKKRESAAGLDARIVCKSSPPYIDYRPPPADNWHIMFEVVSSVAITCLPILNFVRPWDEVSQRWGADLLSSIPQNLPLHDNDMIRRRVPPNSPGTHKFVLAHLEHGTNGTPGERLVFDFDQSVPPVVVGRVGSPTAAGTGLPHGKFLVQIAVPCLSIIKSFVIDWRGNPQFGLREANSRDLRSL